MPGWVVYDLEKKQPYIRRLLDTEKEATEMRADLLRPYAPHSRWRQRLVAHFWRSDWLPYTKREQKVCHPKCSVHRRRHAFVSDAFSRQLYCRKCWAVELAEVAA